jgi:hypothetical protein
MWNPEYFVKFHVGRNVTKSVNCLGQIKIVGVVTIAIITLFTNLLAILV